MREGWVALEKGHSTILWRRKLIPLCSLSISPLFVLSLSSLCPLFLLSPSSLSSLFSSLSPLFSSPLCAPSVSPLFSPPPPSSPPPPQIALRMLKKMSSRAMNQAWLAFRANVAAAEEKAVRDEAAARNAKRFLRRIRQQAAARAFATWRVNASEKKRIRALLARTAKAMTARTLHRCWRSFVDLMTTRQRARELLSRVEARFRQRELSSGFATWSRMVGERREDALRQACLRRFLHASRTQTLSRSWSSWRGRVRQRVRVRHILASTVQRTRFANVRAAFSAIFRTSYEIEDMRVKNHFADVICANKRKGRAFARWRARANAASNGHRLLGRLASFVKLKASTIRRLALHKWTKVVQSERRAESNMRAAVAMCSKGDKAVLAKSFYRLRQLVGAAVRLRSEEERERAVRRSAARVMIDTRLLEREFALHAMLGGGSTAEEQKQREELLSLARSV